MPNVDPFRLYVPGLDAFGDDGYPEAWHQEIKYLVREQAGHRCIRCGHPYVGVKDAKRIGVTPSPARWSPCDTNCTHLGLVRMRELYRPGDQEWAEYDLDQIGMTAGEGIMDYGPGGQPMQRWEIEAKWRVLTVHHLIEKADCREWALVALCQRCHLNIQGRVVMDRAFILEHSDWFKPYAAGYYAWKYLGEEISLAEAHLRQEELLALERLA